MNYINYNKVKSSKKSIFIDFFIFFLCYSFLMFIKIPENFLANSYQEHKEILQKKVCERYQNLSKKEKEKSRNMILNVTKISQKMKNKCLLSIEKKFIE